jgi:hypothetical protein
MKVIVARNFMNVNIHNSGNFLNLLHVNIAENYLHKFLSMVENVHEGFLNLLLLY